MNSIIAATDSIINNKLHNKGFRWFSYFQKIGAHYICRFSALGGNKNYIDIEVTTDMYNSYSEEELADLIYDKFTLELL